MKVTINSTRKSAAPAKRKPLVLGMFCSFCLRAFASFPENTPNDHLPISKPDDAMTEQLSNDLVENHDYSQPEEQYVDEEEEEDGAESEQEDPETLKKQLEEHQKFLDDARRQIIEKRDLFLDTGRVFSELKQYLKLGCNEDLYVDLDLVAYLITGKVGIIPKTKTKIKNLAHLIIKNYENIIKHAKKANTGTQEIGISKFDIRNLADKSPNAMSFWANAPSIPLTNLANMSLNILSFLGYHLQNLDVGAITAGSPGRNALDFLHCLVTECCKRDSERKRGISSRFEKFLDSSPAIGAEFANYRSIMIERTYCPNEEFTSAALLTVMSAARAQKANISPLDRLSCQPAGDCILTGLIRQSAKAKPTLEEDYITLYALIAAINDTKKRDFQEVFVNNLIESCQEGCQSLTYDTGMLKYRIIWQTLICCLLIEQRSSALNASENTMQMLGKAVGNARTKLKDYIKTYKNIKRLTICDQDLLNNLLMELRRFLIELNPDTEQECNVLDNLQLNELYLAKRKHTLISEPFFNLGSHQMLSSIKEDDDEYSNRVYIDDDTLTYALLRRGLTKEDATRRCKRVLDLLQNSDSMFSIISYYDMLSIAFTQTGNEALLERMKSDSSGAIQKIYRFVPYLICTRKFKERDKVHFAKLVSLLDNNVVRDEQNAVKENNKEGTENNEEDLELENEKYDLREVLNFTLNYIVYGTGIDTTHLKAFQTDPSDDYIEGCELLLKVISKLFMGIAKKMKSQYEDSDLDYIDYLEQVTDNINNCLENQDIIMKELPKKSVDTSTLEEALSRQGIEKEEIERRFELTTGLISGHDDARTATDSEEAVISYYDMLSKIFVQTGNEDFLRSMKFDARGALCKISKLVEEACPVEGDNQSTDERRSALQESLKSIKIMDSFVHRYRKPINLSYNEEESEFEDDGRSDGAYENGVSSDEEPDTDEA